MRHEELPDEPTPIGEAAGEVPAGGQQQKSRRLHGARRHHEHAGGQPPFHLVGPGVDGSAHLPGAVHLEPEHGCLRDDAHLASGLGLRELRQIDARLGARRTDGTRRTRLAAWAAAVGDGVARLRQVMQRDPE